LSDQKEKGAEPSTAELEFFEEYAKDLFGNIDDDLYKHCEAMWNTDMAFKYESTKWIQN